MPTLIKTITTKLACWICQRCGHQWPVRDPKTPPVKCPRCSDKNWQRPYIVGVDDPKRRGKRRFDNSQRRKQRRDDRPNHHAKAGGVR